MRRRTLLVATGAGLAGLVGVAGGSVGDTTTAAPNTDLSLSDVMTLPGGRATVTITGEHVGWLQWERWSHGEWYERAEDLQTALEFHRNVRGEDQYDPSIDGAAKSNPPILHWHPPASTLDGWQHLHVPPIAPPGEYRISMRAGPDVDRMDRSVLAEATVDVLPLL